MDKRAASQSSICDLDLAFVFFWVRNFTHLFFSFLPESYPPFASSQKPSIHNMANSEAPLLPKKFYEGCAGCILDRKKMQSKSLPKKELFIIAYLVLVNALPISSLYPFLYFMVRDLGIAKSDTNIATYAGFLGAGYMLGRSVTGIPWGVFADRYGRKPVMVFGTSSIIVFNTLFGFSSNFWLALSWRFFLGFSNGMLGTIRAYVSEVCIEEHQAVGLSTVGTMWAVGLIVGPAIGGYLAQPSEKYPAIFPSGSLFDSFPYALPCLCISMFAVFGVMPSIWLPESLHRHPTSIETFEKESIGTQTKHIKIQQAEITVMETSLFKNRALVSSNFLHCIWSLHDMAYSEVFSLWAVSPVVYGGLGFTTSNVGAVLAASGAGLLVFQLSLFPLLAKILGVIQIARIPSALTLPLVAIFPIISSLSGGALWAVLISAALAKNILSCCVVTGTLMMINNSVVSAQRGRANGISMTFMSLSRAIGPGGAGTIMTWAQQRMDAAFLPGMWMVFTILDVFSLISLIATFEPFLPSSVRKPVKEDRQENQDDSRLGRAASFTF